MCTGLEAAAPYILAASAAATAAGTGASVYAGRKQRKAREDAALTNMLHQQQIDKESQGLFAQELQGSSAETARETEDKAAAEQLAQTQALIQRPEQGFSAQSVAGGGGEASPVVKEVAARTLADELSKAEGQMKARSVLQGMGVRRAQRGQQLARTAEQQRFLSMFGQGWNQVANTQMDLAKNAGSDAAMLGDVLTGLGQIGLSYAGGSMLKAPAAGSGLTAPTIAASDLTLGGTAATPSSFWGALPKSGASTPGSLFATFAR